MAHILIDSDVLIDYLRGVPAVAAHLQQLEANGETLCTCDIVIAEVESGLSVTQSVATQPFIDGLVLLERNTSAARQAGRWRYAYARKGIALSVPDALIAATAHAHGVGILTRNLKHYPMPEITVLSLPASQPRR